MYRKLCALLIALAPVSSQAIPVRWQLQDIIMSYGTSAPITPGNPNPVGFLTGSFVYDADTDFYSNVDITSPDGLGNLCNPALLPQCVVNSNQFFAGQHYDTAVNAAANTSPLGIVAIDGTKLNNILDGDTLLLLRFAQGLTNSGGTVAIGSPAGTEYFCPDFACLGPGGSLFRNPVQPIPQVPTYRPRVVSVAIPEPSTLAVFALGLASLLLVRRRKLFQAMRARRE